MTDQPTNPPTNQPTTSSSLCVTMSMSIIDLYGAASWSMSTALCVLSGNAEIRLSSAIVWSCCWWAPGRVDCPVASSRPSNQQQRRPDNWKSWADNVVWSGNVEWLTVNDVGWECLRLVYSSRSYACLHMHKIQTKRGYCWPATTGYEITVIVTVNPWNLKTQTYLLIECVPYSVI